MRWLTMACWLGCFCLAACGGKAVIDGGGGAGPLTATSTGSTTSAGASGGGASGGGASGGGTASGGPTPCVGWDDKACSAQEWCDVGEAQCGGAGFCKPRPLTCDGDCSGVCACNGSMSYCNECVAQSKGVAVAADASCGKAAYSALLWLGGADHLLIGKKDTQNNVCIVIAADAPAQVSPYTVTMEKGWGVSLVLLSDQASDCDDIQKPKSNMVATTATGSITWTVAPGQMYPCALDLQVLATFASIKHGLSATKVPIEGGCF